MLWPKPLQTSNPSGPVAPGLPLQRDLGQLIAPEWRNAVNAALALGHQSRPPQGMAESPTAFGTAPLQVVAQPFKEPPEQPRTEGPFE